ncbi:MarR family transcriptional regulator [Defluviimonas sp. WL0002]|uniref:MarR family transcriptional regulator n=1 Tax=Albidovulum marisflavi TaxID=2984159 RepID=A0ABT2ZDS8_9RHOB|nr:MarR family transcriptional regulator [Defluviimonas sp. WL0002]MCV2869282.1 MarR family transcriptional regulator [Defluviimonas sp. WL0002]
MGKDQFRLSGFLPYRLAVLSERVSHRLSIEYGKIRGLSVAEWRVLVHLSRQGAISVKDIHDCVNLEKSRVSRAVSRLEAAGLVEKVPGETDGRLVEISLTVAGETALSDILPAARAYEDKLCARISRQDMDTFCRVMEQIHSVLDDDPEAKRRSRMDLQRPDIERRSAGSLPSGDPSL